MSAFCILVILDGLFVDILVPEVVMVILSLLISTILPV